MMDISDGLATDLRHILRSSGVGALLEANRIPAAVGLQEALYDGEDYEILFTVRPERAAPLLEAWSNRFSHRPTCIGEINGDQETLRIRTGGGETRLIGNKAFEHFSSREAGETHPFQ